MRKFEILANVIVFFGLFFLLVLSSVALLVVWSAPKFFSYATLTCFTIGFLSFLKAKVATIRKGRMISFGITHMSRRDRFFYILGYAIMGIGVFFMLGLARLVQ